MSNNQFYSLPISNIVRETEDTVSLYFNIPEDLKDTFQYTQGQYLTLKFSLNGNEQRRAYSIFTSPIDNELGVTVKKVHKGLVSTHINEKVKQGDTLEVMPPHGHFFTPLSAEQRKTYYLFGAGSGITPLMGILKTVLEVEPASTVFLLYNSRSEDSIIFKSKLDDLSKKYEGQLYVEHILSQPKKEKMGGLSGLFSKGKITWEGLTGRITPSVVEAFLNKNSPRAKESEYFICGPAGMMTTVETVLKEKNIDKKHIHVEHFNNEGSQSVDASNFVEAQLAVTLNGKRYNFSVPKGKTILDVMIQNKVDAPYSCTSGACSTCMAKVLKGSVKMDACFALDDDEVAAGYVLTCQSHPTAAEVEVSYDV